MCECVSRRKLHCEKSTVHYQLPKSNGHCAAAAAAAERLLPHKAPSLQDVLTGAELIRIRPRENNKVEAGVIALMSGQPGFVSPFHRPPCLAAAAPAGKAKFTHPGKAILAGKKSSVPLLHRETRSQVAAFKQI